MVVDSLQKIKIYNVDLLICSYSQDSEYGKLTFENPMNAYSIGTPFYDYKRIYDIDILFIDYSETDKLSEFEQEDFFKNSSKSENYQKIKHLVENGIITFGQQFTNYPFYTFVFCNRNNNQIKCFDNIMESKAFYEAYQNNKKYNESIFYPNCD